MPPRRSHKKSRAGCRRCKSRKIKCDEVHPRCSNCVKHGVACDFEHPELAEALRIPETPGALATPSPSFSSSHSPVALRASVSPPSLPGHSHLTLYRSPEAPIPLPATGTKDRMMELRLLHHYTTMTCKTLALSNSASEDIWRDTVPGLAFGGNTFLADAILAVSALHLRSQLPEDQGLVRASHSYMAVAISDYSNSLRRGLNKDNAEALFLTAALIAFQNLASRIFVGDDGGDIRGRDDGYVIPTSWFHAFQGIKTVVASSWQWLRHSGVVIPIIEAQPALNLNLSSQESTFFGSLLEGMEDEIAQDPNLSSQMLTRQAYQHAVAVINWAHKIPISGAPMVFLATVSRRFVDLLSMRRPRALAILACFFALLKGLDNVWWLKGVARREVMGIVSLFDPDDEEWWPRLQWPVQIALHDGVEIPSEVWGADCAAEEAILDQVSRSGAGSFMSHIDMLSQMFNAMQQLPAPLIGEPLTCAYSSAADNLSQSPQASGAATQQHNQHNGHNGHIGHNGHNGHSGTLSHSPNGFFARSPQGIYAPSVD